MDVDSIPQKKLSIIPTRFSLAALIPVATLIVVDLFGTITAGSTNHHPRQARTTVPMLPENLSGRGQGWVNTVQQRPEYCSCWAILSTDSNGHSQ
ncbi:uncharacterized protein BT62DRAFT_1013608 [Guyanagaster necrorhizus]|uniref:Uncharacterized protein n=1 Tax=Guyanagaster necrorhizus TaxID=856835 RepID=A0A9P7VFJ5_9AGAR|nr:uncharacterized protein BT62DRAFT_1013608 [Guyanagaster necrorhizus MCA 3950]KAG7439647.1 hypothetical protein BT62DRAFT_1013608 [Guyanagaster necrorhizus MCA 3950]